MLARTYFIKEMDCSYIAFILLCSLFIFKLKIGLLLIFYVMTKSEC